MRSFPRLVWLGCLLCLSIGSALAQSDVVTTFDGQQAFFSSFSRMPGSSDQPGWTTIFHYANGNWNALAHSDDSKNVTSPLVSDDGSIVAWVRGPRGETGPGDPMPLTLVVSGVDPQSIKLQTISGISPNGRFLAGADYPTGAPPLAAAVQDLTTGQVWNPTGLSIFPQGANDGTFVGFKLDASGLMTHFVLTRWRPGASNLDLISAPNIQGISLSADGHSVAALTEQSSGSIQLQLVDVESGSAQVFFEEDSSTNGEPASARTSISDDGSRVLYMFPDARANQTPQVSLWNRSSGTTTVLPGLPEGAVAAVISGNGAFAWVATKTNRLLRFDLNQGSLEEILSTFPVQLQNLSTTVPGSAERLAGSAPLAGEHFISGNFEFPILPPDQITSGPSNAPTTLLQMPWELGAQVPAQGTSTVPLVLRKDGYPFELPIDFNGTDEVTPALQGVANFMVKAVPSDFSHLIDADDPAIAGQTIVVWLTGLGPLDQAVATGAPGPFKPLAHPLAHLECGLANPAGPPAWQGVALPFIGYAPGLVGVYQVNVTIPADWPTSTSYLDCYSGAHFSALYLPIAAAH